MTPAAADARSEDLNERALQTLPGTFRYAEARRRINERRLRDLEREGFIERLGRGLYRKVTLGGTDEDLLEIASRSPQSTLCLASALAQHGLTDEIPAELDVAVPRNTWHPQTRASVRWHDFNRDTFHIGREQLTLTTDLAIGLYTAERSIIDAYRLAYVHGPELGHEALRRWLRNRGQPSNLLSMAKAFPRAERGLLQALEILL